jgi:hypothetical protein
MRFFEYCGVIEPADNLPAVSQTIFMKLQIKHLSKYIIHMTNLSAVESYKRSFQTTPIIV